MSLGSITNLLSDVPRPTDLGAGQILLQSRGPGELFFGENSGPTVPNTHIEQQLGICKQPFPSGFVSDEHRCSDLKGQ